MSIAKTYSIIHCDDSIVVMHHRENDTPQALTIFRSPQRLAICQNKLIGFYSLSYQAATLLDDPEHNAGAILNAIALELEQRKKQATRRCLKYLACAIAGALIVSTAWFLSSSNGQPTVIQTSDVIGMRSGNESLQVARDKTWSAPLMNSLPRTDPNPLSASESIARAATTETQNMQNAIQENRNALPASPADTLKTASPIATPVSPANSTTNSEISSAPKTSIETSSRVQMAAVLKLNAARGMFTINLSSGHERTLYAFLDPTCSVCRTMEPAIERLAQEFNVIVFPVSVVNDVNNGGNAVEKIAPLLCQTDSAKRASGWQALFRADAGMSLPGNNVSAPDNTECEKSAAAAVAVNDYAFRQFGFKGTPWVVTDTGFRLPTGLLAEPAKIDLFLKTTDSMAPEQADSFLKTVIPQE
ncbi:hypothetical protein ABRP72_19450 [Pectobacterium carotovorum]|uniref:hypothetical protein n=1 Tax=Pectobacterium carotovorum TaxID=554 RepID=UPI00193511C1|nr:hypothetical protein HG702_22450 [Pectobacterium versatile]